MVGHQMLVPRLIALDREHGGRVEDSHGIVGRQGIGVARPGLPAPGILRRTGPVRYWAAMLIQ